MESLLSLSFDYLSSNDAAKNCKGLRQLEGLLSQICLARPPTGPSTPSSRQQRSAANSRSKDVGGGVPKNLSQLRDDPAFREFFKLQEGFQWNIALRLITCLERYLGKASSGQNDLLIVSTLDLLHGILLIHPPSRLLFARENYMNLLLDVLDPILCPAVHSAALLALVAALLAHPANIRTFEDLDGLLTVTSLFKSRSSSREVKIKAVEFLYFYLMPEAPPPPPPALAPVSRGRAGTGAAAATDADEHTRTAREKQRLLGKYLGNVQDLVEDLKETTPFGTAL